ncbi:MAG: hypothetical protein WC730_00975 [Patescibacteria group bacterium]|jgi:hypothetical protein
MYENFLIDLSSKADQIIMLFQKWALESKTTFWWDAGITVSTTLITLLFSVWVAMFTQRKATERQARVDVYRQLYDLKSKVDSAAVQLYNIMEPLVLETTELIAAEPSLKYTQHRNEYVKKLADAKSTYSASSHEYWTYVNAWLHLFPRLEEATNILFIDAIPPTEKMVDEFWLKLSETVGKPPEPSVMDEFKKQATKIRTEVLKTMMAFVDDHFCMAFNELFSGAQKWKMSTRDYLVESDVTFDILTSNGIKQVNGKRKKRVAL